MIGKYNETSLADFVNYNDPKIHNWAENVYEKLRQTGELADYVKRDKVVRQRFNVVDGSAVAPIMVKDSRFTFGYAYRGELLYIPDSVYENIGRIYQIEFEFMVNEVVFGDIKIMDAQILISNDYSLTIHGIAFQLPDFELNKLYKVKIVRENLEVSVYFDDALIDSKILNTNEDTVFNILYGSEPSIPPINVEYDLVVQSVNPGSGVTINVNKIDVLNRTHGVTAFTRRYIDGEIVTLTATTVSGVVFKNWVLDGVDQPANQVNLSVTVDQVHTAIAVYETVVIPLGSITVEKVVTGGEPVFVPQNGALYNWSAVNDERNILSEGWRVPTIADVIELGEFLGGTNWETVPGDFSGGFATEGNPLKETGTTFWDTANGLNTVGFNMRGGGYRSSGSGNFIGLKAWGSFWLADRFYNAEYDAFLAGFAMFMDTYAGFDYYGDGGVENGGYAARGIKESTTLTDGQTGTYTGNDGKVYRTICIGNQEWIADNLCETKYRNDFPKYSYLYNWYTIADARNICAEGWHIPTAIEERDTVLYLEPTATFSSNTAGTFFKEVGFRNWRYPNLGATNAAKFNAKGSAQRIETGTFGTDRQAFFMWLADDYGSSAPVFNLNYNTNSVSSVLPGGATTVDKRKGMSLRPVKDSTTLTHGQEGTYTGNDGKVYRTICIGGIEWLADNLAETKFRTGDNLTKVTDNSAWAALTTEGYCALNNDDNNVLLDVIIPYVELNASWVALENDKITFGTTNNAAIITYNFATAEEVYISQSFTITEDKVIDLVHLDWVSKTASPDVKMRLHIYEADNNHFPTGLLYSSSNVYNAVDRVSGMPFEFKFDRVVISAGIYCFVTSYEDAVLFDWTNQINIYTSNTNPYAGGYLTKKIGSGAWTMVSNSDIRGFLLFLPADAMCNYNNDIDNTFLEVTPAPDTTQFQVAIDNGIIGRSGYVSQGNPLVFSDLELGSYAVTEYPIATHNLVSIETSPVVLTEIDPDQSVVITNEPIPEAPTLGSITINKTIIGTSEDPAVEFEFTITGTIEPLLILTQMGSIGSPAVFNELPLDTYTITEANNPEYPLVSITPDTVTLTELDPNQVVAVVNEIAMITGFGLLYNFHAVNSSNILAPIGTRIATDDDYTILATYLGGATAAGDKLRTIYDWGANAGTNSSGWSGRPGGFRAFDGAFSSLNTLGIWWTSTGYTYDRAWKRDMGVSYEPIQRSYDTRKLGGSVRFIVESGSAPTVTDIDGNVYNIVQIGTQRWATTNLKVTKYRNGVTIPYVANAVNWNNLTTGALCAYNNNPANV